MRIKCRCIDYKYYVREISIKSVNVRVSFRIIKNIKLSYINNNQNMDTLRTMMRQEKQHEIVIFVLLVLYIVFTPSVPLGIAEYAESIYGQVFIVIIAITIFLSTNPVVGVLAFFAAYEFIRRSSRATGSFGIETFSPTETKKKEVMTAMNPEPLQTLEEELVQKLVPISPNHDIGSTDGGSFQPVLGQLYGAVAPDYEGVM